MTSDPTRDRLSWRLQLLAGLCTVLTIHVSPLCKADENTTPPPFFAKVDSVTATNSLMVTKDGGEQTQVVLAFLSIPTLEQPYGQRAQAILKAQLEGRRVSIRPIGEPHEGYTLGLVYVRDNNFNLDFLKRGHAWLDFFQISHPAWKAAQASARASGIGLYADPNAMHPITWTNQLNNAKRLRQITDQAANDPGLDSVMRETFIGHKQDKVYVPVGCIQVWSHWPKLSWVPITTHAGAAADGFRELACESAGQNPPSS